MNKIIIPRIETERLILCEVKAEDLDEWAKITFADPDVMRYMPERDMSPRERAERAMRVFEEN
jgi:RimJ/RimL family protein N-acetyltransferase